MRFILTALLCVPLFAQAVAGEKELTREMLVKGSTVPEKREFPLSTKIGACENFHDYVCKEVETKFKLPADRSRWNFSFTDIYERLLYAKKQFFKNITHFNPKTNSGQQIKDTYLACMDEKTSKSEEKSRVESEKKLIEGLKTWQDLADLSQKRLDDGDTSFVQFFIEANSQNPLRNDAFLIADARSLPERSYYEKKDVMADFEKYLVDFFKTIKMDKPEQRAKWVIEFETALAQKYPLPKEVRERFTEKRTIDKKEFLKKYPNLKLERFMARLNEKSELRDFVPESAEFINNALATMPLDQLKSVYIYNSLDNYLDDAYPAHFAKGFEFRKKHLGGPAKRPDRQERCTKLAMGYFGMELDQELMPILFPNFPEERVVAIGENMRKTIVKGLKENTWLTRTARKEAIKKIENAKLFLVKPQKEADWDLMPVKSYSDKNRYANSRLYSKTRTEKYIDELKGDRLQSRWDMNPLEVNAYYNPPDNKFVLLQGILQYPFFDPESSDIENIAAIGTVIGHELGHGIDDEGSKFDYEGKVRTWMSTKDLNAFKERGNVFVAQFDKIGHDGKLTLGENIGDHVGLTFAYNTAFPDEAKASVEDKKKFFVAYARMWCNVATPSYEQMQLKTNPHSLGRERINQQVIHQKGFYDAFSCKAGDKMYLDAKERVRVW